MTWVRIDDHFDEHPKVAKVGPVGMALQVAGLCYANRHLTNGFVPRSVARSLVDFEVEQGGVIWTLARVSGNSNGLLGAGRDLDPDWAIGLLVSAGLWEPDEGGYRIHDYEQYQPTREQVLAAEAEAKRRGGRRRAQTARRDNDGRYLPGPGDPGDAAGQDQHTQLPKPEARTPSSPDGRTEAGTPDGARDLVESLGLAADTSYLLGRLCSRSIAWIRLVEDPAEVEQLQKLAREHGGALVLALQQAIDDPSKIRNPGAWLRSTVPAIEQEAREAARA